MIHTDYHLHTDFSSDSTTPMKDMIETAIKNNMKTICFTEHHDIDYPDNPENLSFLLDFDSYQKTLLDYQDQYRDRIQVLIGIELGLMPDTLQQCRDYVAQKNLDFIIGSSHIIEHMDPYEPLFFQQNPGAIGLRKYFEEILYIVKHFDNYSVYGHLDYAARYIKDASFEFHYADYGEILDEILKNIISKGKGIEVNTAGWKYGMPYPNPHISILKRYLELGGEILSIGSDGHRPEHLAYDFHRLPDFLKDIGFKYYTIFREMKPEFIEL